MISRTVLFIYFIIAVLSGGVFSYIYENKYIVPIQKDTKLIDTSSRTLCNYSFERLKGYKHIRPLVWAHPNCESDKYYGIKMQVKDLIQNYISSGILTSASFDLRDLKEGDWITYNGEDKFNPASLMKVPLMITVLRMAENKPGLLDKEITFDHPFRYNVTVNFADSMIKLGDKYTIRELVRRMIQYSDNDAALLLSNNIDEDDKNRTFSDFGFQQPGPSGIEPITCMEFSSYMELLYNAGYLTIQDSEYAVTLLSSARFKQGIMNGIPDSIQVAHKFGESGNEVTKELHESGIIYYGDSPYLLTVMTKGPDINKLPEVISAISGLIYKNKVSEDMVASSAPIK